MTAAMQQVQGHEYMNGYPNMPSNKMHSSMAPFSFQRRYERVDWKKLASVDVDSLQRNMDFLVLQDNIMNVAFCNVEAELDLRTIDPNYVKLFKMAQMMVEYLLHSQDYLTNMVAELEQKLLETQGKLTASQKEVTQKAEDVERIKKESHKRKKMLVAQQHMMMTGAANFNKCPYCAKAFVNNSFLQAHLKRRHADAKPNFAASMPVHSTIQQGDGEPKMSQSGGEVMERELVQINERLRMTESMLEDERIARQSLLAREQNEIERLKEDSRRQMEAWKSEQEEQQKADISKMQAMFMKELKELNAKYMASNQALEDLQHRQRSNLGALRDDEEEEKVLLRRQREEVAVLKEQLKEQMDNVQESMQSRFDDQGQQIKELEERNKDLVNSLKKNASERVQEQEEQSMKIAAQRKRLEEMQRKVEEQSRLLNEQQQKGYHNTTVVQNTEIETIEDPVQSLKQAYEEAEKAEENDTIEDDTEDDYTTEGDTTEDLTSVGGTLQHGTTTLSLTGTLNQKTLRLMEQLKKDPNLLNAMKVELSELLDNSLEKRGIPRNAKSIDDKVFQKQMEVLKKERQQTAKRFQNLFDIRQQYISEVDNRVRELMQQQKREAGQPPRHPGSSPQAVRKPQMSSLKPTKSAALPAMSTQKSVSYADEVDIEETKRSRDRDGKPKPHPRSSQNTMSSIESIRRSQQSNKSTSGYSKTDSYLSGTATSFTGTYTGTYSDTGSYTETGSLTGTGASHIGDTWNSDSDTLGSTSHEKSNPKAPPRKNPPKMFEDDDDDDDNDFDDDDDFDDEDASELQEVPVHRQQLPRRTPPPVQPRSPPPSNIPSTPQPKGQIVSKIASSIERQLSDRGKRPVGGVDTMEKPEKNDDDWDSEANEEDDEFSVSSLEEDETGLSRGINSTKEHGLHSLDTDYSSNTYNTSMWGDSARDQRAPRPSPRKTVGASQSSDFTSGSRGESFNQNSAMKNSGRTSALSAASFDSDDLSIDDL